MEYLGVLAFFLIICYSSYPEKVERLSATVKRLEKQQKGMHAMSKLIGELMNRTCKIEITQNDPFSRSQELICHVLDMDDDWIKVQVIDKKNNAVLKLLRIESIKRIELVNNTENYY